jgi:hypothetical protein
MENIYTDTYLHFCETGEDIEPYEKSLKRTISIRLYQDEVEELCRKSGKVGLSIGELFEAYFEDPLELYDSPHFDNYLAANFASPQKFTQEMTDFIADKTSQFIRESNTSSKTLKNRDGQEFTMPILDYKNMDLYYKYLQYVKVILGVLTKKSEYAGKVKEAERTGQYLSNLYTSLRGIGSEFMNKQNLLQYFSDNNRMNPETIDRLQSLALEIKTILSDFGFKR